MKTNHGFVAAWLSPLCSEWPIAIAFRVAHDDARRVDREAAGAMDLQDQTNQLADSWSQASKAGFVQLHLSPVRDANRVNDWLWLPLHLV